MSIPRSEYPRPQLVRADWMNLNGKWQFEFDETVRGFDNGYAKRTSLDGEITVPFCPESKLSGIGNTDFHNCVWYLREFELPGCAEGKNTLLHFGAVDYKATVYVNGERVGVHEGGYSSFSFDITGYLAEGKNIITVAAEDYLRDCTQPAGKQSRVYNSHGPYYTRTTGIWQTVWLEFVSAARVENFFTESDIVNGVASLTVKLTPEAVGATLTAVASYEGKEMGSATTKVTANSESLSISLAETHLWECGAGRLYGVVFKLERDGELTDTADGYFGLRTVAILGNKFLINGKSVFGRWVLDQGFYPDGIYTAPSDEALKADIINSMKLGFNGARLHEKIFEPRFLYWADKLGYTVWGEHANWGLDGDDIATIGSFLPEWLEAVERDKNHPSIIGWCPFNEAWDLAPKHTLGGNRPQDERLLRLAYLATKAADHTRPCIDNSGGPHIVTDIFDAHDYEQDPGRFAANYGETLLDPFPGRERYEGQPYFVSEYGGIKWDVSGGNGWGYGRGPENEKEFLERYKGLTDVLLDDERICGFCYTQLYDVEQEVNGLMTYDRRFKFDPEFFHAVNTRKAKIEE